MNNTELPTTKDPLSYPKTHTLKDGVYPNQLHIFLKK